MFIHRHIWLFIILVIIRIHYNNLSLQFFILLLQSILFSQLLFNCNNQLSLHFILWWQICNLIHRLLLIFLILVFIIFIFFISATFSLAHMLPNTLSLRPSFAFLSIKFLTLCVRRLSRFLVSWSLTCFFRTWFFWL